MYEESFHHNRIIIAKPAAEECREQLLCLRSSSENVPSTLWFKVKNNQPSKSEFW